MGKRSWKTVRDTERARSAAHEAAEGEREQKSRVSAMLAAASRSFAAPDVMARLDAADARDRAEAARQLEAASAETRRLLGNN